MTQETKLTEPVQVGLWYQTGSLAIIKIDKLSGLEHLPYPFDSNIGVAYDENGYALADVALELDLIRCLGADPFKSDMPKYSKTDSLILCQYPKPPFKQVDISKTETTTSKMETVAPTQFERIFTTVLGGLLANPDKCYDVGFVPYVPNLDTRFTAAVKDAIEYTQEAIKQLKELGE